MTDSPLADLTDWHVTVSVARPPSRDRHGNEVPGTGSKHTVATCILAPRSTEDPVDRSELVSTNAVLFAPATADIARGDTFTVDGHPLNAGRWRVDGAPQPWPYGLVVPVVRED